MSDVFASDYAAAYDSFYGGKDYASECDLLEALFAEHAEPESIRRLLDLGCGTGNHSLPLAARGYDVVGVDRSRDMLAVARSKQSGSESVTFEEADLRTVDLGRRFDAALMLFAVFGYQHSDDDARAALRTVARHLRPGGLFLFDVWYGPAVEALGPGTRRVEVPTEGGRLVRDSEGTLLGDDLCQVRFAVRRYAGDAQVEEFSEAHVMRYFTAQGLRGLLNDAGLELLRLSAFPNVERPPAEDTWNVIGVARAAR